MAKKKANTPIMPSQYSEFILGLKLQGLGLDEVTAAVHRPALGAFLSKGNEPHTHFDAKYSILTREAKKFVVGAIFTLLRNDDAHATDKSPLIAITINYSALFHSDLKVTSSLADRFAQSEARLIFWPYARYFISDISSKMAIDQLLLPLTAQFDRHLEERGKK